MNLIKNNPYRTVGLLVGATAKEQTKQISRLKKYIEAEQDPQDDFSFPALGNFQRTIDSVEEAASKLNLDNDKINAALFWFWNGNPITDEAAFDALKDGNTDDAIEIWRKLIYNSEEEMNEVTKRNASAFFNLSTLYLIEYGIDEETLQLKLHFLGSDFVKEFKSAVTDETYKIEKGELQLNFLNNLINHNDIDHSELMEAISDIDFEGKQEFLKSFIQKPIEKIEHQIETAKNKRKASKANAAKAGQELIDKTVYELSQLKGFVGSKDLKYTSVADKVANEILQCSIDFFNDSQEKDSNSDYTDIAFSLAKQAEKLAAGKLTKDRIKDSIETLEEMKDKELLQAIQLLQSVKEAYETNEREIRAEVKRMEETDVQIQLGYRSINWSAVEDNIQNSINWEEVNKLLISILPENNLKKIKESDKSAKKKEFWELANWLKEKSKRATTITTIIEKYKKIPPRLPFKIVASTVTNTGNKPLYTKFIRYIGLNLSIEVTESKTVDFYVKYFKPNGSIDRSSKSSPNGYTLLDTKNLTIQTRSISLTGWGNSDKCTYDTGKHRIEVYIDEYLIHSIEFNIDIAPSEKLEIELKKAESKLSEIKNSEFFKSELERAKDEMNEIQKFQLFRSSSTKHSQISEQERKISTIKQKAETEKKQKLEKQNKVIEKLKSDLLKAEY
ncbi:MAG: hypothetical protein JSR97_07560 [Verrucomicrobia bacterium]|nr:hypothetical protein [Verrucomicrobiota bacterium]